jgi:hypothetical protein
MVYIYCRPRLPGRKTLCHPRVRELTGDEEENKTLLNRGRSGIPSGPARGLAHRAILFIGLAQAIGPVGPREHDVKNKNMLVSDKRLNAVLTFHFPEIF